MDVGIGLPNQVPGVEGPALVEFARRADAAGFSTLATIGRVAFPGHDDLISLAAAAGVTDRIRLMTNILLVPTHDPVLLAKQAATVDQLSGGRLVLGVAVGSRADDYQAVGRAFGDRGRRMDAALEVMRSVWAGEPLPGTGVPVAPAVREGGIPLLIGGTSDRAIDRVIRFGIGWTSGGGGPERAAPFVQRLREAWTAAGKPGAPRLAGLAYFALGDAVDAGRAYLRDYYRNAGPYAEAIASAMASTDDEVRAKIEAHRTAGFDEVILDATVGSPGQVDLLAGVAL